jgi:ubiquitin-like 1-activating enzyme E1 A
MYKTFLFLYFFKINSQTNMATTNNTELTEAEAEQYDRQIRLWGQEAQKRMRDARVLIVGVSAIGAEVTKNVVLSGMNVTIYDDVLIQESDLAAQFFVSAEDIGQNVRS